MCADVRMCACAVVLAHRRFPERAADPRSVLHFVKHAPFPMSRPLLETMADTYAAAYAKTASFKFRDYDTVDIPTLHNMYCQVRGS
jgi:hypothetical protein